MSTTSAPPLDPLKLNLKKAYDSITPFYNEWTKSSHPIRIQYITKLIEHLTRDKPNPNDGDDDKDDGDGLLTILEAGCGGGDPTTSLLAQTKNPRTGRARFKIIANDISSAQLEIAATRLAEFKDRVELRGGDMMALSFDAGSLDAVVGMYSFIHLPREEQVVFLKRLYGWLKPGGWFLGNFAVEEREEVFDEGWLGSGVDGGVMFWSGWGAERMCEILGETGFEVVVRDVVTDLEENDGGKIEVPFIWVLGRK
ncbi:S-adenosyl-L-methionine-dependent methyltransferase [Aspergillus granulosus]|uniref:S-adenosyl-L-methionine-dependent methyltransferase n=1 Tax=Aspergillus granulosus TaxID=176169 RepID=A0ABR4HTP1_9EURO